MVAAGLLSAAACAREDNSLAGSVKELFPLSVSRVDLLRNAEAFQISYLYNRGADLDVVIRLSLSLKDIEFVPGATIALDGDYAEGHPRTSVVHAPGGEPVRVFPRVKRGDFNLSSGGDIDQFTRGDFSMVFDSTGGDIGSGRTLEGTFAGTPADAGFGPLP